jgi:uncharacterized damage-inducible protein DinB
MLTTIAAFEKLWSYEAESTLKVFAALTDASLNQSDGSDVRTLGRLAWHIVQTIPEMMARTGLHLDALPEDAPVPGSVAEISATFTRHSESLLKEMKNSWTDESLTVEDDMYGERWTRGYTLLALTLHQAHHRGQMTILMRQANLVVPGFYGPAREDWTTMGVEPPPV